MEKADMERLTKSLDKIEAGMEANKTASADARKIADEAKAKAEQFEKDLKAEREAREKAQKDFDMLRKQFLLRGSIGGSIRRPGFITDDCARAIACSVIANAARKGHAESLISHAGQRDVVLEHVRTFLGMESKTALTTSDIPLPTMYTGELKELIAEFGQARRLFMPYPITMGTAKPSRIGTRPAFGSIAMSAAFAEKSPTITFADLSSHKIGGIVRTPREIDEQSIVPMGQFIARYGAVEFARAEDTWAFLADGTATYESVSGLCVLARSLGKYTQLGATLNAPSDATREDLRSLRRKVSSGALGRARYVFNLTWEARLRSFNTQAEPNVFVWNGPGGQATFDGFPITWVEVLTPYGTDPSPSSYVAAFGDFSFWLLGEHGSPRVDQSSEVYFVTDELGTRFIEEIDIDYLAADAVAVLQLAA